jgi:hypothetical protein
MGMFDIVMKKPAEVSRSEECVWYSDGKICWSQLKRCVLDIVIEKPHSSLRLTSAGFSMTISNIPIASTDFSRFFHDYIKHTHRLDWLHQVFPWLYQTHPSPWLTSAGFSMTIKHTHRLDWLQQVVPWLCQAHTSSTDFSRFFHDYIKHPHRFDWLQQVFSWLYQPHSPLRLTSAGLFMTEVSRSDGCVWYSHGTSCWSQSRRWVCLI